MDVEAGRCEAGSTAIGKPAREVDMSPLMTIWHVSVPRARLRLLPLRGPRGRDRHDTVDQV